MYFDWESFHTACIICKGLLIFRGCQLLKKLATLLKVIKFRATKTLYYGTKSKHLLISIEP